jgi:lipopolysaccharide export system protein LptC
MSAMALQAPERGSGPRHERGGERGRHHGAHRRYSRFVGIMKIVLPSAAAVLLGLIVAWPRLTGTDDRFHIGFANIGPEAVDTLSMVNARYFGVDERNKPFTVTADMASEEKADGVIVLQSPKADFTTRGGANVYIEARQGFYRQKDQLLDLVGDVNLFHDQGYELHTEEAQLDLARSTAHGTVPVTGQGPQGMLEGEGFRIEDGGKQVIVTGRSSMKMQGAKKK